MKTAVLVIGATLISIIFVGVTTGVLATTSAAQSGKAPVVASALASSADSASAAAPANRSTAALMPARINMTIVPDALLGSNKKTHDAYIPASITALAGQQVIVTVYNLDTAPHSFTAPALGLNIIVPAAAKDGELGVKTFSFTAARAGTYHWKCILPCDNGGVNAWAMTHDGYMAGTITIQKA